MGIKKFFGFLFVFLLLSLLRISPAYSVTNAPLNPASLCKAVSAQNSFGAVMTPTKMDIKNGAMMVTVTVNNFICGSKVFQNGESTVLKFYSPAGQQNARMMLGTTPISFVVGQPVAAFITLNALGYWIPIGFDANYSSLYSTKIDGQQVFYSPTGGASRLVEGSNSLTPEEKKKTLEEMRVLKANAINEKVLLKVFRPNNGSPSSETPNSTNPPSPGGQQ